MIRSMYRTADGQLHSDLDQAALAAALKDTQGLLWLDLADEPVQNCWPILRDVFGFHPLAIDDALEESHSPKVDDWGEYIYMVLQAVTFQPDRREDPITPQELDLFLGRHYLVTYHTNTIDAIERVWTACQRDERPMARGTEHLAYQVVDELVTDYMPVVEAIDDAIDRIEDEVFDQPGPDILERIFTLKRAVLHLRRIFSPQREVLNKLGRGDYDVIDPEAVVFFRDVYDHLVRLHDITEGLRDLTSSVLDTYLSVVSNRMNDTMRTLTLITTLFMPVSFLVGFFGMNFFQPVLHMKFWTGLPAFGLVLLAMIMLPAAMYFWVRSRMTRW